MVKSKKVPELRFMDFKNNWSVSHISKVTTYVDYRGKTPPKANKGIFLVTAKNIKDGYVDYDCSKEFVDPDSYKEIMSRGLPNLGDVLITTEAPCGNVAQVDNPNIALAQRVIKYTGIKDIIHNDFLKYEFLSKPFQQKLQKYSTGGTVKGIKGSVLHKINIIYPSKQEQQKIADFLTTVDSKIQNIQQQIQHLQNIKKGYIQKIFSQEIRFKDDDGKHYQNWRIIKFKKVFNKIKCKNKNSLVTNVISNSAKHGLVSQMNFFDKEIANKANIEGYYIIRNGDFVYNPRKSKSAPYGPISLYQGEEKGIVSPLYLCFKANIKISNEFFLCYFKSSIWYKYVHKYGDVGARHDRVSIKDVTFFDMPIYLPCLEEQQKIADFLLTFDEKIELQKQILQHWQTIKKGLLQKMFV